MDTLFLKILLECVNCSDSINPSESFQIGLNIELKVSTNSL